MARGRKGRNISGWVIVDKPAGITSTAVVNKIRWAFDAQKAGHAGTLDPDATGLLAVALGEATKTIPYVTDALKAYEFTVTFGASTSTDDASGEVVATSDARPTDAAIKEALNAFVGDIMQVPPAFSAIKIDGERAYDLAREGQEFEIAARPLFVESLLLVDRLDADHAVLEMTCGKGGYVRSIARDLGAALGCYGHVLKLRRIWSSSFTLKGAVTMEQVESLARTPALDDLLQPLEVALADLPMVTCPEASLTRFRNGNPALVFPAPGLEFGDEAWVSVDGRALAIGQYRGSELHPARVIVGV
ncbi:tRNA pseudouridine(55) synthase TruB [Ketogulonicigenium vulgare]|uniref:tRNA pseudouridine synthase B n=1 Tax=Ketogulonicigenium vulgare (strain WSH-001) TaxID=759362 RepID=F9Y6P8_KETVW|nr:tRNA pseudouridine(55) synthase TruB [Ketogulonicigenium vulgare]ADO43916.1 tRNA pseudouridine synthase B [Ketogulonicigenium vulgare Y25]AEM42168.1 tRNA pseudouridine synthase B [Ketogulonicigenium vulgare WSH-001]ALJ79794.1 pseudouridine synthase [Ketogulonicigenium vulgare]ANW32712.1 tRNA pseudouridine(55) synthase TruB [Ketogulonicigenium vulgare]AOZ55948.1 tRNA pseudouridine synthase B [Ketogulonicigenium vulgare]